MIEVKRWLPKHVEGISRVCIKGRQEAISHIKSPESIGTEVGLERRDTNVSIHNKIISSPIVPLFLLDSAYRMAGCDGDI